MCSAPTSVTAIGSTYVSDLCGGGVYPLAQSLSEDISFSPDNGVTQVYINPCNTVQSSNCAQVAYPTSVCQAYYPLMSNSTNVFQLAVFDPTRSAVQYTRLTNGIIQYYQDGAVTNGAPRATNISFVCSSTTSYAAAVPSSWRVAVDPNTNALTYSVTVNTPAVCGTPFTPPTCGGAGVNLNSIAGVQLVYPGYYVAPCANVLTSASGGCSGQACQGNLEVSFYDPAVAVWTLADNGVVQQIQDGRAIYCNANSPRQTTLRFICNATATTPFILTVQESVQCHYDIAIMTSAACGYTVPKTVGTTWISDQCGGGAYNLNLVSPGVDIQTMDGGNFVFINPCGTVYNASCAGINAAVCYAYAPLNFDNPSNDFNLATWSPISAPIRYTLLSNGIQQTHMDGAYCGNNPRTVIISYICDTTAITPNVTFYNTVNDGNTCTYSITINTNKVCTAAYSNPFAGCGGAGYDLSQSVAGVEMTYIQNDDGQYNQFTVNPCSSVAGLNSFTRGCTGQACQPGISLSYYNSSARWYAADNGVIQFTQNGQECNGEFRSTILRFVCNVLATTPYISEGGEQPGCQQQQHHSIEINPRPLHPLPLEP